MLENLKILTKIEFADPRLVTKESKLHSVPVSLTTFCPLLGLTEIITLGLRF